MAEDDLEEALEEALEEEPKLEDYLRVELNSLNGLPGPHIILEGANFHVRNGSGGTGSSGGDLFGLGNIIVGYNEQEQNQSRARTGWHNLVVGGGHGYTSYGGSLAGFANQVSAANSSVIGGTGNEVTAEFSSVTGGQGNRVTAEFASISGGFENTAGGPTSSITGGRGNRTSILGEFASVTGGTGNTASGLASSVNSGERNSAIGDWSSVLGGRDNKSVAKRTVITGAHDAAETREGYIMFGGIPILP